MIMALLTMGKLKEIRKLLWLLLWKTFIFRRRNVALTLLELLMAPGSIGCMVLIIGWSVKGANKSDSRQISLTNYQNQNQNQFQGQLDLLGECDLIRQTRDQLHFEMFNADWQRPRKTEPERRDRNCVIGFVPNTVQTRKIMLQVQDILALETSCDQSAIGNLSVENSLVKPETSKRIEIQGFDSERDLERTHLKWEIIQRKRLCIATIFNSSQLINAQNSIPTQRISYKLWYIFNSPEKKKHDKKSSIHFGISWKKPKRHMKNQHTPQQLVNLDLKMAGFQLILDKVLTQHVLKGKLERTNGDPGPENLANVLRNYSNYELERSDLGLALQNKNKDKNEKEKEKDIQLTSQLKTKPNPNPKLNSVRVYRETKIGGQTFPLLLPGFIFIFMSLVRMIIVEKRSGLKGLLVLLGVPSWMHPFSWYLCSILVGLLSAGATTMVFTCTLWPGIHPSFPQSNILLLFLIPFAYVIHGISLIFAISPFFNTPYLGVLTILVICCQFSLGIVLNLGEMSEFLRHLVVLCMPSCGFALLISICGAWENMGVGLQWDNLSDKVTGVEMGDMSCTDIFMLMGISSMVLMTLAQYFDNILPQSFAVAKPWYYPLAVFPWFNKKIAPSVNSYDTWDLCVKNPNECEPGAGFEVEPQDMEPGVSIYNLRKEFVHDSKLKVAVDGISLNLYRGQITALLGHNGAGKTTLISMLTGLLKPTSGTAIIDGYDLNKDLALIRHKLALCPQQNVLCDDLTVNENLLLFGQLKGLSYAEAEKEATTLMASLGLMPKKDTMSKVLSGGQKRKVQLGMSFIGGTTFIFLDEPTSAMDVESRRLVWDLLLDLRKNRTILLTTHYMEEAEVLGDRIAIQDKGRLKCCGTSFFLKQFFGMGYTLHLQFREPCGKNDGNKNYQSGNDGDSWKKHRAIMVLEKVGEYLSGAKEKPRFLKNSYELDISLPMAKKQDGGGTTTTKGQSSTSSSSKLAALLQMLSSNEKKEDLDLEHVGLSATTVDDVFTAAILGSTDEQNIKADKCDTFELDGTGSSNPSGNRNQTKLIKTQGFQRSLGQFQALLRRRWQWTVNDKILLTFQILVPVLMMFLGTRSLAQTKQRLVTGTRTDLTDLKLFEDEEGKNKNWDVELGTKQHHLNSIVTTGNTTHLRGYYSHGLEDSVLVAINSMSNAVLRTLAPSGIGNVSLEVARHYLNSLDRSILDGGVNVAGEPLLDKYTSFMDLSSLLAMGLTILHISFVILPLQEKKSKIRHLELMTNLSPVTYWLSFLVWDFVLSSIITGLCILTIALLGGDIDLIQDGGLFALWLSFSMFNFAGIIFSYFLTTICGSPALGLIISIAFLVLGIVAVLVSSIVSMLSNVLHSVSGCQYLYLIWPYYGIETTLMNLVATAAANSKCNFPMSKEIQELLCDPNVTETGIPLSDGRRACCPNCHQDFPGAPCFKSRKYFVWDIEKSETVDGEGLDIFGGYPGFSQSCVIVAISIVGYLIIFLASEYKIWRWLCRLPVVEQLFRSLSLKFPSLGGKIDGASFDTFAPIKNQDVQKEAERIQNQLRKSGNVERDSFIAENLCKRYGNFRAVSNVSFGVHPGECFGLLGVNGAGKSSLFKIITGEKSPTFGNAHVQNGQVSLQESKKKYLAEIGYCPQSDALLGMLSGRQSLELFARLRGCAAQQVDSQVNRWLTNLGLEKSADSACGNYSGGMKRRLNVAMALIGNPSVIFLDEPSAGVDPISRQQFWRVVASLKNSGKSVILTSHCMDEVHFLCSRMTIMVNSALQCFGSGKQLQEQFPQGYILKIQLKSRMQNAESPELQNLISRIKEKFQPCILKELYQNFLTFSLKNPELSLAQTFAVMENLVSEEDSLIQEYSVGEPTLEQIFLAVAGYESQHESPQFTQKNEQEMKTFSKETT